MAAFYSGDNVNAVVADIGQFATKMGWAGDDYPRSYFRSNVAVQREEAKGDKEGSSNTRRAITDVNCDYYTRLLDTNSDGKWEVANPVDPVTGLWYDPEATQGPADWYDLIPKLIQHGYSSALHSSAEKHPLMMVERSYNPPPIRQQVLECVFEELDVPATFFAKDAVLACYACGRTTGTVVDMGYGGTTVTPVYDGYVEQKGLRRSPAGVLAIDNMVLETLDQLHPRGTAMPLYQVRRPGHAVRGDKFHLGARLQLAQECREVGAGAAMNTTPAGTSALNVPHKSFELPDGTVLNIPSVKRFAAADVCFGSDNASVQRREELLQEQRKQLSSYIASASKDEGAGEDEKGASAFTEEAAVGISKRSKRTKTQDAATTAKDKKPFSNRHLLKACTTYLQTLSEQLTASPVANMVCDAAYRCDRDQQAALLGNVVVTGGGACLGPTEQAVPDYFREKVEAIIHTHTPGWRVKVLAPGIQERSIGSWLGGSILGSLGTFHDMWISKADYEEWGSAIVNRKCP